jgi:anti-sigma B factor antagonist
MDISHEEKEGIVCVKISGRLDGETAADAEAKVREILDQGKNRLLFDLSRMDYISSAGLRVVLMTVKELQRKSGRVVLCALRPYVKEVFEVSNFATIIPITDSVEAGLKRL